MYDRDRWWVTHKDHVLERKIVMDWKCGCIDRFVCSLARCMKYVGFCSFVNVITLSMGCTLRSLSYSLIEAQPLTYCMWLQYSQIPVAGCVTSAHFQTANHPRLHRTHILLFSVQTSCTFVRRHGQFHATFQKSCVSLMKGRMIRRWITDDCWF